MMDKKWLNLYAGILGNREKWAGVKVTNIELDGNLINVAKERHPDDEFIQTDAHQYLLDYSENYDGVWSSPPCPTHSRMAKATRHKLRRYTDMALYQEIIYLKHFFKGKWVVENVKPFYEPLIKPTAIIGRHYFWANFHIPPFKAPEQPKGFITSGTAKETQALKDWLGIQYEGNIYHKGNHCPGQVLRNAVHPDLGLHIFKASQVETIQTLFI